MDYPMETKERNHVLLWLSALALSAIAVGVFAGLFASFEHDSWFPPTLARLINEYDVAIYMGLFALGWLGFAVLFYAMNLFVTTFKAGPNPSAGYGGSSSPQASSSAFSSPSSAGGNEEAIFGKMQISTRVYWGDFYLTEQALYFVNYKDESAVKANAGQAIANQFGLIGVLIKFLLTRGAEKKLMQELEAQRQAVNAYPLEERIGKSPSSFKLTGSQIQKANNSLMGGAWFESDKIRYVFQGMDKPTLARFGAWFIANGVPQNGFDK